MTVYLPPEATGESPDPNKTVDAVGKPDKKLAQAAAAAAVAAQQSQDEIKESKA